jgi:outer membrane protein assembly factor BamB
LHFLCLVIVLSVLNSAVGAEPWSTFRGNPQRTGNTDGRPGPAQPKVLWALKSPEHFVASPVVFGDRLFIAGLGAFNASSFHCLAVDPKAAQRTLWTKSAPFLKLPTVSSPAIADGNVVFGDGMHQTNGAVLSCVKLDKGLPFWQLPVPGTLVHLEGSPTIVDKRVYIGGGAAGVLCVHLDRVTLDGKEMSLAAIQKVLDAKWKELLAKYEEEKKKDPVFAVPPNEDQLPMPAPLQVWQQGNEKWHVDAPVAVVGDCVLVASAFLDKEKLGDRALYCLDARTGEIRWRAPLAINPWGGPTVAGDLVVVSSSTIGYDTKAIQEAKGQVAAFSLTDGKEKWKRDLKGGAVSCAAVAKDLVIVTATDGKVRAFDLASGQPHWTPYDAKAPLFAPPAVAGDVVYVADLRGVIHALGLADGKPRWALDLSADPEVKSPGMVYSGPVVQGGRLFVATCNLQGTHAGLPTAVVCIGEK